MSPTWIKKNPRKKPQPRKRKWLQIRTPNQQKKPQNLRRQQSKPNQFQKRM